jgi:hypothetical protein
MVFGHAGDKIGGREMARGGLEAAPVHEQAVGPAVEHAVDQNGFGPAQAAAVIMANRTSVANRRTSGLSRNFNYVIGGPLVARRVVWHKLEFGEAYFTATQFLDRKAAPQRANPA